MVQFLGVLTISIVLCSTASAQGGGGESTKTKSTVKKPVAKNPVAKKPKTSPSANSATEERTYWESIRNSTDPADFRAYLKEYPNGKYVTLATNRLTSLAAAAREATADKERKRQAAAKPGAVVKNSIGIEFVLIPTGEFMMGSDKYDSEKPIHSVTISNAFYMGKYEVTQAHWQAVMGHNPSYFQDCGGCPVQHVSWNDAQDFINKLNEANDGFKYRLPSEAEWEYACRAGTTGDYYAADLDDIGWYQGNSGGKLHSVGGKQPNAFGVYDMSGNVREWCRDWYHDNLQRRAE